MAINWFPGHMVQTKREIQNNLKLVDAVIELEMLEYLNLKPYTLEEAVYISAKLYKMYKEIIYRL
ncbi:50S ribosomal subunit maturation GTPase RbgA [Clostridium perfringens]|nr:50S ribosomal subunit maturation GTPase RbgA [Clostridium perfringens]